MKTLFKIPLTIYFLCWDIEAEAFCFATVDVENEIEYFSKLGA